jgi:thymidylate kinase
VGEDLTGRSRDELACLAARLVDGAAGGAVVVLGSLPPGGRDLDVLARGPEREAIEHALTDAGFAERSGEYANFSGRAGFAVEVLAAEEYLPRAALDELWSQALPLEGMQWLRRPSPAHGLLLLASVLEGERMLSARRAARLEKIELDEPDVWQMAGDMAASWEAIDSLKSLRSIARQRAAGGAHRPPLPRRARTALANSTRGPRGHAGMLVSLSGIDGAGKSTQARRLADTLGAMGVPIDVVWNDVQGSQVLDAVAEPIKRGLRLAGVQLAPLSERPTPGAPSGPQARAAPAGLRPLWGSLATASGAILQRRSALRAYLTGQVMVFDRGPLDLAVRMEVLYRTRIEEHRRLVQRLAPRAGLAFLLDIPAEESLSRKDDIWLADQLREQASLYRELAPGFGVRRVDGTRDPDDIAAELAREVWLHTRDL